MATVTNFDLDTTTAGSNAARSYQRTTPAIPLAPNASIAASGNFNGQTLTLGGLLAEAQIGLASGVALSGNTISVAGVAIASRSGGVGGTPLVFTFNSNATAARVQTLVRNLTYADTSATPAPSQTISFSLAGVAPRTDVVTVTGAAGAAPDLDLNGSGTGNDGSASFIEQTPTTIAPVATLTDADSANLASLTATLQAR